MANEGPLGGSKPWAQAHDPGVRVEPVHLRLPQGDIGAGAGTGGGGGAPPSDGGTAGGGTPPPSGMRLDHFVGAVGLSVAAAAQNLRATPVPAGTPGVELRSATLTLKASVTWDAQGVMHLSPAKPGEAESALSQLVLAFEPVPRLPVLERRGTETA